MEGLFFVARLCILPGVGYRECRFGRTPLYCRWETRSVDLAVSDFLGVTCPCALFSSCIDVPWIGVLGWRYYCVYRAICVVWLPRRIREVGHAAVFI